MRIGYATSAETAKAIAEAWRDRGGDAHARPYNRYQAEEGDVWWAIPSAEWPAFRYAKVTASTQADLATPGKLFVGFYVEKGLGQAAVTAGYCPSDWFMDVNWRWYRFVEDVLAGRFRHAVAQASHGLGEPLEITVVAQVPIRGARIAHPRDLLRDLLTFESHDGSNIILRRCEVRTEQHFLSEAASCRSLALLGSALQSVPDRDWAWIDVYIGHPFDCSGLHDSDALDTSQVWNRLIQPFAPWLV